MYLTLELCFFIALIAGQVDGAEATDVGNVVAGLLGKYKKLT